MTITAELHDGRKLEFPDGTDPAVVQATVKRVLGGQVQAQNTTESQSGLAMGLTDPIHGGAQLLTKVLPEGIVNAGNRANNWLAEKTGLVAPLPAGGVDQQVRERESAYQASRGGDKGVDWSRLAGNVLSPANLAMAGAAPGAAASLAARVGVGAGVGAASSLSSPVTSGDFTTEKLKQLAIGAVGGAAVPLATAGIGRVISPNASRNPNLELLKSEGVFPTVGQSLGGRWNSLEEKLTSVPILGDAISNARGRTLEQFNKAAVNRAANPIGAQADEIGQGGVAAVGNKLSQAYDDAASMVGSIKLDNTFKQDLTELKGMARSLLPDMRRKFDAKLKDVVGGRVSMTGVILPETFKKVDSEIGGLASKYGRSTVASEQELGDAFKQLQALLREQAARTNPSYAEALGNANAGWANLVRVEGAAKAAKNAEGVFTPAQLNAAIQAADNSVRKRAVARGSALMQDLGNAGQQVVGNKVPNSFTTDRALIAGGALGSYLVNPAIPAGLLGGAALYSRPAQALLRGAVASRPASAEAIRELLNKSAPMLSPAGGLLGVDLLNQ